MEEEGERPGFLLGTGQEGLNIPYRKQFIDNRYWETG